MRPVDRKQISLSVVLLLVIVLTLSLGCGGQAQTDTSVEAASAVEVRSFSDYDFSFQCPKDYLVWQDGLLDEDPSEDSGLIQVAPENQDVPLLAVSWIRTWQYGLEGGLEAGFEGIENWEGIVSVIKGELVDTTKTGHRMLYQEGHPMLYQYYTATTKTQEVVMSGIVGVFYCPDTQRAFSLVTMQKATGETTNQLIFQEFESYVKSFVCHT
jgi:hypothetical protein